MNGSAGASLAPHLILPGRESMTIGAERRRPRLYPSAPGRPQASNIAHTFELWPVATSRPSGLERKKIASLFPNLLLSGGVAALDLDC